MDFDKEYYDRLYSFFQSNDDVVFDIENELLEDKRDKNKFIFHVKLYIENRQPHETEVTFNAVYTKLRLTEFFDNVIRSSERNKDRNEKQKSVNIQQTIEVIKKSNLPQHKPLFK